MNTPAILTVPGRNGLDVPYFDIRGERDGPQLTVLAGVHGAEYASIAAAREFVATVDAAEVLGRIIVVPVVTSPPSGRGRPSSSPATGSI